MSSEVAHDATLKRVTPATGKGALGTWRSRIDTGSGHGAGKLCALDYWTTLEANHQRERRMWAST